MIDLNQDELEIIDGGWLDVCVMIPNPDGTMPDYVYNACRVRPTDDLLNGG
jgi:hypothetical protein